MDERYRALQRRAKAGDEVALQELHKEQCRLGEHVWPHVYFEVAQRLCFIHVSGRTAAADIGGAPQWLRHHEGEWSARQIAKAINAREDISSLRPGTGARPIAADVTAEAEGDWVVFNYECVRCQKRGETRREAPLPE